MGLMRSNRSNATILLLLCACASGTNPTSNQCANGARSCRDAGPNERSDASSDAARIDARPPRDASNFADSDVALEASPTLTDAPLVFGDGGLVLRIDPPSAVVRVVDGASAPITFRAVGTRNGVDLPAIAGVTFQIEASGFGSINATTGVFQASGRVGGVVQVFAVLGSGSSRIVASANVEVFVARSVFSGAVPSDEALFGTVPQFSTSEAPQIVYPLEGSVMPRNVHRPRVQWTPIGGEGDVFRVRVSKPHAAVSGYFRLGEGFSHGWKMDELEWATLAASERDADISVAVDRYTRAVGAGVVYVGPVRRFRLARGMLHGRAYYWELAGANQPMQIDPVTGERSLAIPNVYTNEAREHPGERRCMGCHTVSRNGRYMWGSNVVQISYDLTVPLGASNPSPMRFWPTNSPIQSGSFDPSGTMMVGMEANRWTGAMIFVDAATGRQMVPQPSGVPAVGVSFPEWSPDGSSIAYACNSGEDEAQPGLGYPRHSDLCTIDRVGTDPLLFGRSQMLHVGSALSSAPEQGDTDSHPAWTPDSQLIVFQHGIKAFTVGEQPNAMPPAALYVVPRGGGTPTRLSAASGITGDAYWPTVTPYVTEERDGERYYWITFYARRPYGNAISGAHDVRQLWIAAVRATGAGDLSFTPYWLPGQDVTKHSLAAYWGADACRPSNEVCTAGTECCSGTCTSMRCAAPSAGVCRAVGELCGATSECCSGGTCSTNRCVGDPDAPRCSSPPCA